LDFGTCIRLCWTPRTFFHVLAEGDFIRVQPGTVYVGWPRTIGAEPFSPGVVPRVASLAIGQQQVTSSGNGGDDLRMSQAGLSLSQIDALFTLFKERENKEKLTGEAVLRTYMFGWVSDPGSSYHMTSVLSALTDLFYLS